MAKHSEVDSSVSFSPCSSFLCPWWCDPFPRSWLQNTVKRKLVNFEWNRRFFYLPRRVLAFFGYIRLKVVINPVYFIRSACFDQSSGQPRVNPGKQEGGGGGAKKNKKIGEFFFLVSCSKRRQQQPQSKRRTRPAPALCHGQRTWRHPYTIINI